jgi:nucleolin
LYLLGISTETMAKTKEQSKSGSKVKSEVKPLSKVQNVAVTKPSQTPITKSKQVAKDVPSKAMNGKADKKSKKVTPPSSDEESDEESAESASSEDESEAEAVVKKPVAATNGKANGNGKLKKKEVDTSDSSSSSASDSEASDSDSSGDEKSASEDSDDSNDSDASDAESEAPAPVAAVAKNAVKKTVEAGKAAVNGAAKAVAKATVRTLEPLCTSPSNIPHQETSDSEDSASSEEDEDEEEVDDDSDDSDDSESTSDEDEEEPSKKRKADDEPAVSAKKAKKETATDVEDTGSKNLFVGNLSWNVDDEWLYREFEEFGELTGARVISDRESGRSKGFGYVEFAKSADAAKALKAKKGALIDGREANVDFSTPRGDNQAPKERANKRAQSFGDSKNPESDTLFVGNLSFEANEDSVGEAFGEHGTVTNVRLPTDM